VHVAGKSKRAASLAIVSALALVSPTVPADAQIQPASDGMFLCISPMIANRYWTDLLGVAQTGVQLNRQIAAQVAKKHDCPFIASTALKPIRNVAGALLVADGARSGWADPTYYVIYINGRVD